MLYAVTGRPGEGKSCFAVQHLILKELEEGTRPIYTNIWLHRGKIKYWLKERGIVADLKRLHYLEEWQIRKFWTYAEKDSLMVLDEVGEFFNASAWKELQADPEWDPASYARLHRKVGHETYLIVQDLNHIYKQYRDLISIHIQLVNCAYRKILLFSGPKLFIAKHFDQLSPHKCIESHTYRYNKEVFSLYDTTQVYEINSGVKTGEKKEYKDTVVLPDSRGRFVRVINKILTALSRRFFGIIIILACFAVVAAVLSAPGCVAKLVSSRAKSGIEEKKEEVNEEDTDTKSTGGLGGLISRGVEGARTFSGGKNRKAGGGGGNNSIRYDSVTKRVP